MSLSELASVFVLENAKAKSPQHPFILVVPLVVLDRFSESSLFHELLTRLKDTEQG